MDFASPGELVRRFSDALDLPLPTIVVHDRALADAGLRSRGGRGRSAAKVNPRDAANLLIAILAGGQIKNSADVVQRYALTRPQRAASSRTLYKDTGIKELSALPADHTFVDALAAVLAAAAFGSLAKALPFPLIEVAAHMPGIVGDIRLSGLTSGSAVSVRYTLPRLNARGRTRLSTSGAAKGARATRRPNGDFEEYRRISQKTILALAQTLADTEEAE